MNLGLFIKSLRVKKELTLHQVCIASNIDSTILSKIERSERLPTIKQLELLSVFFEVSFESLQTKLIAEKIQKEYGINQITINALKMVQEGFVIHMKEKND